MSTILLIIPPERFRDEELFVTRCQGAAYTGPGVTVDGNIITANAPKASQVFGQKINAVLAGKE